MLSMIRRSTVRSFFSVLLIASVLALSVPLACAADSGKEEGRDAASTSEASKAKSEGAESKLPNVLNRAFEGAMSVPVNATPETASRPRRVTNHVASVTENPGPEPATLPLPSVATRAAVSTAPMTAKEKFSGWFHSRFLSPGAYGAAVASGMIRELQDNDDFKKDTVENFFADSMTRAARSFTFGATAGLYEKAILATLFKQDPRYHRSGKTGAGAKIGYAVSRVFVTQGDRCGCDQFNASFLLGGAAAAVTANLWERRERTGPMHTISRWYNHIAITAFFNVVKEFVGGQ
jgi:hypothetical protein